jgi:hypothetical protein
MSAGVLVGGKSMKYMRGVAVLLTATSFFGCTPEWASQNAAPYILEIAGINGGSTLNSDVGFPVTNDDVTMEVNILRKNNQSGLSTSAVEHAYLESYEVRYFRTDGRSEEGVDVPFRVTGALGNLRFHTPAAGSETALNVPITIVRHQAKVEPPLRNLQLDPDSPLNANGQGTSGANFPGSVILTVVAEVTVYGRTLQGHAMQAKGRLNITFADFP